MTNYSENPGSVRIDYFKTSGKWYMTESVDMSEYYTLKSGPIDAVKTALEENGRLLTTFNIVCLEPYHENAYPVFIPAVL